MRESPARAIAPAALPASVGRLSLGRRHAGAVRLEMYARIGREPDGTARICDYLESMEPPATRLAHFTAWARAIDPTVLDAIIGTAFTVVGLFGLLKTGDPRHLYRSNDALGVVLALACSLPYYVRRRAPLAVLLTNLVALALLSTLKYHPDAQSQMVIVGAFTVGSHCEGRKRVVGLLSIGVAVFIVAVIGIPDATTSNLALSGALYVAAYLFGTTVRNRRLYTDELELRATSLERAADEEAKRAVADERLRIAQELHDVVAHSMGVIAVQAGVGEHVIDTDPSEAKRALAAIATTSRSTLTEIRRLLGVLRDNEGAEHAPAPGLGDLPRLVNDLATAGLHVDVRVTDGALDLPPGVDLTAYRIVQEGLTNVLKHAGPATACVDIRSDEGVLDIEITDDGRGVNGRAAAGGHGLLGMRERVAVYGGTLATGPRPGGGYRVAAEIPFGVPE
jgi:signal transduction histidine kinase